jgi:hypothetical protein
VPVVSNFELVPTAGRLELIVKLQKILSS